MHSRDEGFKVQAHHNAKPGLPVLRPGGSEETLIYTRIKNLRAVQILLGHSRLDSTARYLGIEVDDALEISEQTEIEARFLRP